MYLRHAKAGELCERFNSLHLVSGERDRRRGRRPTAARAAASFRREPPCAAGPRRPRRAGQAKRRRADDRRPDAGLAEVHAAQPRADRREGTVFEQAIASFPLCCPSRATPLTGQYAHNHGVLHNSGPFGGYRRLDARQHAAGLAAGGGLPDDARGRATSTATEYARRHPARMERLARGAALKRLQLRALAGQRERVARLVPRRRASGRVPDRLPRPAGERADRGRPPSATALLPRGLVRRAPPRRARATPTTRPRSAPPPRRRATATCLRRTPLPRPPSFDEAHMRDKPQVVADRPRLTPAPGRRDRGELAPGARGAAVRRRGGRADGRHPRADRRARQHADRLHLRQRVHARRAPRSGREGAALRGVDPGAAGDARTRHPARLGRPSAGGEHRPRARRSSTPRARPRNVRSTGVPCSTSKTTAGSGWDATS